MIEQADIDCAGRTVPGDVCFVASALAGRVIRILEEGVATRAAEDYTGDFSSEPRSSKDYPNVNFKLDTGKPIELPYVCKQCLLDSLPAIVRHATGTAPNIRWVAPWPESAPFANNTCNTTSSRRESPDVSCETIVPLSHNIAINVSRETSQGQTSSSDLSLPPSLRESRPRIGIVGNALLCFDAFMNDNIVAFIESQGCEAVLPDPALLYTEDVRYLPQLDRFAEQGVQHVIYLQSFGCLKGHIRARGALHELARRYPTIPVTVIDYDPEASALNRENRIRLALAAAKATFQLTHVVQ